MTTRRKIWAVLTLFVVALFTVIIPLDVYDHHTTLFTFLSGGLLLITLGQTIGDFDSVYELFEKDVDKTDQPAGKKMAPFAIIPAIIFGFGLIFYNGGRKDDELKEYGVLTKGSVQNGSSTTTTRRFQSNTSYDIIFLYQDSTGKKQQFEQSVSGSEFNDAYIGQEVDIVYSKKHPALARAILSLDELAKYKTIADHPIEVQQLIAILESHQSDTIVNFLNGISYQWAAAGEGVYSNEKRNLAIKVFPGNEEIAYMDNGGGATFGGTSSAFEKSMEAFGFKKKAITQNNETQELYYTDKYGVTRENKHIDSGEGVMSFRMATIYHVFVLNGTVD
jgi:hypothetical protein